jgi:tripartite-type tricarboxylate transporter receptor subunit TctC
MTIGSQGRLAALLAVSMAAALALDAFAQGYPARPVRIVIAASPGGAADTPGRILGAKLAEGLSQSVVLDNRPGASGVLGTDHVAKSAPDGYTLLLTGNTHAIRPAVFRKLPYHPLNDFAAVAQLITSPNVLVVHPSMPVRSVRELISLAQARPGQVDYVSSGVASAQHLCMALFVSMTGLKLNHVPYKGSGQARSDLLGGHVPVGMPGIASVIRDVRVGRLRALGVTSARRSSQLPEVPTLAEAGVAGYEAEQWNGLLAPAGTPLEAIERLNAELGRILKQPEVQQQMRNLGAEPGYLNADAFGALIKTEMVKWSKIVDAVGARAE